MTGRDLGKVMLADDYQQQAHKFAAFGGNQTYAQMSLVCEAAEVLDKYAKFIRKHEGFDYQTLRKWESMREPCDELEKGVFAELGDVLWNVAEIATNLGFSLGEIMVYNLAKLTDRQKRNVIIGEGDNR